ncbi:hypothetical protein [Myxosarcina sp. GI1(2024)]
MKLPKAKIANTIFITLIMLIIGIKNGDSFSAQNQTKLDNKIQKTIRGQSGGTIDSKGCGFIANTPNYTLSIAQRVDYMRLKVQASGGQPTLLVLGPKPGDRFCILGEASGLQPEISGVWEAGRYQIYVGDRLGENYQFTLDISTEN